MCPLIAKVDSTPMWFVLIVPPLCFDVICALASGPHHHDHDPPYGVNVNILRTLLSLWSHGLHTLAPAVLAQCRGFCALIH